MSFCQQKSLPTSLETQWNHAHIQLGTLTDTLADRIAKHLPGSLHIVADSNTYRAIGGSERLPHTPALIFDTPPHADAETAAHIRHVTAKADALLAIGSGTLNDLCKYASFLDGKPYAVIATAPSMNGYVSANASITVDGFKHTLPAHAPAAVLCDIPTLSAAPLRLIQAGLGDILCRSTVQCDWLLSHYLLGTPYRPEYFEWLAPYEAILLENSAALAARQPEAIEALIRALLVSGLAMRDHGSSAPASQGEHMLAHTMEMLGTSSSPITAAYHGEEIAVTSLAMSRWQERLLASENTPQIAYRDDAAIAALLPESMRQEALAQYHEKLADKESATKLQSHLNANWLHIRRDILAVHLPTTTLEAALSQAGAPTLTENLGWDAPQFDQACSIARFTRNRFTFLDLE